MPLRLGISAFILLCIVCAPTARAQAPGQSATTNNVSIVEKARVLAVKSSEIKNIPGTDTSATYQTLSALILSGVDKGKVVDVENDYLVMKPGDVFFLTHTTNLQGGLDVYTVLEPDRLPALGDLFGIFVLSVVLIGGWTGLRGLLALGVSILLVFYALLPGITAGYDPVLVSFGVAALIVVFGSYLTHGLTRTTSAAVLGLVATVGITALIAHFAISATQLSGAADENTVDLSFATHGHLDLLGLLLGAMLIGALGILYDAAISQAVAVDELLRAAPHMGTRQLFARAMRIGREHIGALVNTLAIAYVGVALPLLLLFQSYGGESFLQTINHELFATEIVRAIVGSLGILFAVPISTIAAIILLTHVPRRNESDSQSEQVHGHTHG